MIDAGSDSSSDSSVAVSTTAKAASYEDYTYLVDDKQWFHQCRHPNMFDEEIQRLSSIQDRISSHADTINRHFVRSLIKGKLSRFARVVYVATVIRHLILHSEAAKRGDVLPREEFINNPTYVFKAAPGANELLWLPRFKRAMRLAYPLIDRANKKQFLLDVCSYLEGSYLENMQTPLLCITGSKATDATKRRVKIFEEVSGTTPVKRPPRMRKKAGNDEGVMDAAEGLADLQSSKPSNAKAVSNGKGKKRTSASSSAEKSKKKSRKDESSDSEEEEEVETERDDDDGEYEEDEAGAHNPFYASQSTGIVRGFTEMAQGIHAPILMSQNSLYPSNSLPSETPVFTLSRLSTMDFSQSYLNPHSQQSNN